MWLSPELLAAPTAALSGLGSSEGLATWLSFFAVLESFCCGAP
jgi:hypothetical protein